MCIFSLESDINHSKLIYIDGKLKIFLSVYETLGNQLCHRGGKCIGPWDHWSQKILGFSENISSSHL